MRRILFVTASLLLASASPTLAREYPWCARTATNGGNPQCDFSNYQQCQATVSGQAGDCIQNPGFAYGEMRSGARAGWQDNRWDNRH